jgi:hypothetical protein
MYSREAASVSGLDGCCCVCGTWFNGCDCLLFCDVMLSAGKRSAFVRNPLLPAAGYLSRSWRQQVLLERWVSFYHTTRRHIPEDILLLYSISLS